MVKDIAQKANGAQIKINSEKDKKSLREVSVAIHGTLEGKYKAAHLIIEQVETFRNGGPVSYHSFSHQFRCSIPVKPLTKIQQFRLKTLDFSKNNPRIEKKEKNETAQETEIGIPDEENQVQTQKSNEEESGTRQAEAQAEIINQNVRTYN